MTKIIDTLQFTSEVETNKIPKAFYEDNGFLGFLNDYGRAVLKNTMLARAYLKLSSRIESKLYDEKVYLGDAFVALRHNHVKGLSVITLTVDVKEDIVSDDIKDAN